MRWCAALALVAVPGRAAAHQSSIKYADVTIDGPRVALALTVAPADVTEPLGLAADATPTVTQALAPAAAAYVATWVRVEASGAVCPPGPASSAPDPDGRFVVVRWDATCPAGAVVLDFTRFFAVDARHEAVLSIHAPGEAVTPQVVRYDRARIATRSATPRGRFGVLAVLAALLVLLALGTRRRV